METYMVDLEKVRSLSHHEGLSVSRLFEKAGMDRSRATEWKTRRVKLSTISRIASVLKVDPLTLIIENNEINPKKEVNMIAITPSEWCALPREEQNSILINALSSCSSNDYMALLDNPADNSLLFGICAESLRAPKSRDYYLSRYNEIEDLTDLESSIIVNRIQAAIRESV